MANKTLLDCVNETLKRVNLLDTANTNLLTSLTNSSMQNNIDVAVQVINEGVDELYTIAEVELPGEGGESTITMVTGTREYALASGFVKILWPFVDRTNTQYLNQWRGSYNEFLLIDPQQVYTGLPEWAMISPITGLLRVDRAPDASTNGRVYTYEFEKDLAMSLATDTVPFNNLIFRSMVPAWAELYKREKRKEFDAGYYKMCLGRAARMITEEPTRTDYSNRSVPISSPVLPDPFSK